MRGVFDGDGCLCLRKNMSTLSFSIVGGSKDFLHTYNETLSKNCGIEQKKLYKNKQGCYVLNYNAISDVNKILNFLYKNSNGLKLSRKELIFKMWKNKT